MRFMHKIPILDLEGEKKKYAFWTGNWEIMKRLKRRDARKIKPYQVNL